MSATRFEPRAVELAFNERTFDPESPSFLEPSVFASNQESLIFATKNPGFKSDQVVVVVDTDVDADVDADVEQKVTSDQKQKSRFSSITKFEEITSKIENRLWPTSSTPMPMPTLPSTRTGSKDYRDNSNLAEEKNELKFC